MSIIRVPCLLSCDLSHAGIEALLGILKHTTSNAIKFRQWQALFVLIYMYVSKYCYITALVYKLYHIISLSYADPLLSCYFIDY